LPQKIINGDAELPTPIIRLELNPHPKNLRTFSHQLSAQPVAGDERHEQSFKKRRQAERKMIPLNEG
jgi:hypothetical protein